MNHMWNIYLLLLLRLDEDVNRIGTGRHCYETPLIKSLVYALHAFQIIKYYAFHQTFYNLLLCGRASNKYMLLF